MSMVVDWQIALPALAACFLAGMIISYLTRWRVWVTAIAVSITSMVIGAIFHPIFIELGNALAAFLPALAGATAGLMLRHRRTA